MADLITIDRAKYNINQSSFTSAEDDTINALIDGVSKAIQRYCRRELALQSRDEVHYGSGGSRLILHDYPVVTVTRVATAPAVALRVKNTSSANQQASVRITSTGLLLTTVASGTTTAESEIDWSSNATVTAVKDAIVAKGNGWTADIPDSDFALWSASELSPAQGAYNLISTVRPHGALNAKATWAPLRIWSEEISDFDIDVGRGILLKDCHSFDEQSLLRTGLSLGWHRSHLYRVIYSAGYSTVPEDVQEVAAQWVASLFWQTKENPAVYPDFPSAGIAIVLDHYRRHSV